MGTRSAHTASDGQLHSLPLSAPAPNDGELRRCVQTAKFAHRRPECIASHTGLAWPSFAADRAVQPGTAIAVSSAAPPQHATHNTRNSVTVTRFEAIDTSVPIRSDTDPSAADEWWNATLNQKKGEDEVLWTETDGEPPPELRKAVKQYQVPPECKATCALRRARMAESAKRPPPAHPPLNILNYFDNIFVELQLTPAARTAAPLPAALR